jgi:hypothetical protein
MKAQKVQRTAPKIKKKIYIYGFSVQNIRIRGEIERERTVDVSVKWLFALLINECTKKEKKKKKEALRLP